MSRVNTFNTGISFNGQGAIANGAYKSQTDFWKKSELCLGLQTI